MKCCLCKKKIEKEFDLSGRLLWSSGHNAYPLKNGRCCGQCNRIRVIPARIKLL